MAIYLVRWNGRFDLLDASLEEARIVDTQTTSATFKIVDLLQPCSSQPSVPSHAESIACLGVNSIWIWTHDATGSPACQELSYKGPNLFPTTFSTNGRGHGDQSIDVNAIVSGHQMHLILRVLWPAYTDHTGMRTSANLLVGSAARAQSHQRLDLHACAAVKVSCPCRDDPAGRIRKTSRTDVVSPFPPYPVTLHREHAPNSIQRSFLRLNGSERFQEDKTLRRVSEEANPG